MTHEELNRLAPELQARCNDAIRERSPKWSRYAVDRALDDLMTKLAPDWSWMKMSVISGVPAIVLTQYNGPVE